MTFELWYKNEDGFTWKDFDDLLEALDEVEVLQQPPYEYDRRYMTINFSCGCNK